MNPPEPPKGFIPEPPTGLAINLKGGNLYWAISPGLFCSGEAKIQRASFDGKQVEDIVTGLGHVRALTFDPAADKLYWTDECGLEGNVLQRCDLDGRNVETIQQIVGLSFGVFVDPVLQKVYWTGPAIKRADTDGSDVEDVVTLLVGSAHEVAVTIEPVVNPADLNGDGHVNGIDLALLLGQWTGGGTYSPCPRFQPADLNHDCKVNGLDLAMLLAAWAP